MKKTLIILTLICCSKMLYAQHSIVFKDTFIVVRKVNNDTGIHQKFIFRNNGKLPLSIKSWKPLNDGIECKYSKGKIKQNDSGFLYFIFSIKQDSKAFSKKIEFTFSNGTKQQLEIIYCADNDYVFGETTHNFGTIEEGIQVKHRYKYRNISKETLFIYSCYHPGGGSIFGYNKETIFPNQYFEIDLRFMTNGKDGQQDKVGSIMFSNSKLNYDVGDKDIPKLHINFTAFIIPRKDKISNPQPLKSKN